MRARIRPQATLLRTATHPACLPSLRSMEGESARCFAVVRSTQSTHLEDQGQERVARLGGWAPGRARALARDGDARPHLVSLRDSLEWCSAVGSTLAAPAGTTGRAAVAWSRADLSKEARHGPTLKSIISVAR